MASSVSTATSPGGTGTRGPAPPLPEKPPSVAERTRLLRSSFRKEDSEKPKVTDNRSSPLSEKSVSVTSVASTNGERSPSPSSSNSSPVGLPRFNNEKKVNPQLDSNKDVSTKAPPPAVSRIQLFIDILKPNKNSYLDKD